MHEIGIMESTIAIAIQHAKAENATRITEITMRIGEMSGVYPPALEFAFDVVTKNTIAENATLKIETIPVCCYCDSCQQAFHPTDWIFACPHCGQLSSKILQGKEIELVSLKIVK